MQLSSYKTLETMMLELVADKCSISTYQDPTGYFSITLEIDGFKLSKQGEPKDTFFGVFRLVYDQYQRAMLAVPELAPHRLPAPRAPEPPDQTVYTEYTVVEPPSRSLDDEIPF
jgi:hypothetical protein